MLTQMKRRGSPKEIRNVLAMARQRGLALRTTLIVGFPGESEDAFNRLYDFVGHQEFDHLGAFAYSPEEGTLAAKMDGQIPEEVKEERLNKIMTLQREISLKRNQMRVGTTEKVLVTGQNAKGFYTGRSQWEAPDIDGLIYFTGKTPLKSGDFAPVKLTKAETYDLIGEQNELT